MTITLIYAPPVNHNNFHQQPPHTPAASPRHSIEKVEIQVRKIYCVDMAAPMLPISIDDAARSEAEIEHALELGEQLTRETKFPHAVWVAGCGLIAALLPNYDVVDNLWLEPFYLMSGYGSELGIGCTKITKAKTDGSRIGNVESRSYLEKKLVFCFGSYVASQMLLLFGEENIISSSELKQIATRMVIQYGWGPDDSLTVYHHGNAVTALSMGDNHEYEMAAKISGMDTTILGCNDFNPYQNQDSAPQVCVSCCQISAVREERVCPHFDKGVNLEKLIFLSFLSHFRVVLRGSSLAGLRTTSVRKLLPESWGFVCPDGAPCRLLNHMTASCRRYHFKL
ncbi:probable inactive ATP-dependent zinc metalloprotease FTSHI 5, chloroplastic [Tanacetum coccineum]